MKTFSPYKYIVIGLVGVLCSFFLFLLINENKKQKNSIIVKNAISKTKLKISDELQKIDLVIESMAYFFESTPEVSQKTFERFTNPFKDDLNT